jgi:hypothetical protein
MPTIQIYRWREVRMKYAPYIPCQHSDLYVTWSENEVCRVYPMPTFIFIGDVGWEWSISRISHGNIQIYMWCEVRMKYAPYIPWQHSDIYVTWSENEVCLVYPMSTFRFRGVVKWEWSMSRISYVNNSDLQVTWSENEACPVYPMATFIFIGFSCLQLLC